MNFTSKQREVVARKLGYDGPMQGFDDFLKSSPALMMKYNAVSDKYTKKMAQGGAVMQQPPMPTQIAPKPAAAPQQISDDMIKTFFNQNKNNPAALKQASMQYNVPVERIANVLNIPVDMYKKYVG